MPDAMTTLLANVGLSDLERRLRDEAIDETTFLDLDDADLIVVRRRRRSRLATEIVRIKTKVDAYYLDCVL